MRIYQIKHGLLKELDIQKQGMKEKKKSPKARLKLLIASEQGQLSTFKENKKTETIDLTISKSIEKLIYMIKERKHDPFSSTSP